MIFNFVFLFHASPLSDRFSLAVSYHYFIALRGASSLHTSVLSSLFSLYGFVTTDSAREGYVTPKQLCIWWGYV